MLLIGFVEAALLGIGAMCAFVGGGVAVLLMYEAVQIETTLWAMGWSAVVAGFLPCLVGFTVAFVCRNAARGWIRVFNSQ